MGLIEQLETAISGRRWPVYLFGATGRGKSCAMACLYASWPGTARWYSVGALVRLVLECRNSDRKFVEIEKGDRIFDVSESGLLRKISEAGLVCFDDLGVREMTDTQREIAQQFLDARIGKPLVVTINLTLAELAEACDARIASRLSSGIVVKLGGPDRRAVDAHVVEV